MTAEIAILNREAVAMAADSAVTVGIGDRQKSFASANKIFALSLHAPVGIMVYGSAAFMQIPWETVIKRYRERLRDRTFSALADYANDFLEWIGTADELVTKETEDAYIARQVYGYFNAILRELRQHIDNYFTYSDDPLPPEKVRSIFAEVVHAHHKLWKNTPNLDRVKRGAITQVRNRADSIVGSAVVDVFKELPLTERIDTQLTELGRWLFLRMPEELETTKHSGVVVAGFGDDDLFPRLQSFTIEGRLGTVLNCRPYMSVEIGEKDGGGSIVPFAQADVVHTFMEGINPDYQESLNSLS